MGLDAAWRGGLLALGAGAVALGLGIVLTGCPYDPLADGLPGSITCHDCHGSEAGPAPPRSVEGATETTDIAVGAHQSHLFGDADQQAAMCAECHVVPERVDDPGHVDGYPPEVTFGVLAGAGGLNPEWDREAVRCTNVYCHGASLGDGGAVPIWTVVDGTQAACGTCHGTPPEVTSGGAAHPPYSNCWTCHPDTVLADGALDPESGTHIDGVVEIGDLACNACHGDDESPAPPPDTSGNTDTSAPGVGAHRSHLGPSDWHAEVACNECHLVPEAMPDPGHVDSALPAEVVFGDRATAGGTAEPVYDPNAHSCNGMYCHGYTLFDSGPPSPPVWTAVGTGVADCGTCHGLPPAAPHLQLDTCDVCHGCVVDDQQAIVPGRAYLHINGEVNLEPVDACPGPPQP